ncbi:MAG: S1C family serine protease [Rhodanobacter sp.]
MKHAAGTLAFIARFVILGLAVAFVVGLFWPGSGERMRRRFGMATPAPVATATHRVNGPVSYADAVAIAAPSVVNIYANKIISEPALKMYDDPLLQRLLGGQPTTYQHREQTLGSGVIVSAQGRGYVLTNNHVIAHAADIQVLLYDGRIAKATLVGADEETDLAVLKIDGSNLNLPVIRMADQQPLRAGDVVLAIGNPLGLNQTVTMGIVSAVGRQLNSTSAEDFIQTDAAINPGNSGGALVNTEGELIGINTLLIGNAAGAEGIGFAIPVATARKVLDQLITTGHVVRGWLGANYAFVPLAVNGGLPAAARGVQVSDVYPGGPAAQAGIKPRDILLQIGDDDILDPADLRRREAALKPGSTVQVSGLRDGVPFHLEVTLAQRPPTSASASLGD